MSALTHGDLFAGIAGFSLAAERAGMRTLWQVEIDPVARSVLARHWPDVTRYADVTTVSGRDLAPVDVITAGFPCQDLSVAGTRGGLEGARSGLFWEITRIVTEMREATSGRLPAVLLLENVPGWLSSDGGRDFGRALDDLAECGAVAIGWRILDARWFRVAQRRRRVFVVADFRDKYRPEQILALADSLSGHPAPRREAGQDPSACSPGGAGSGGGFSLTGDAFWREGANPLAASDDNGSNHVVASTFAIQDGALSATKQQNGVGVSDDGEPMYTLDSRGLHAVASAITASAGHHGHSSPRGDGSDNLVLAFTSKDHGGDVVPTSPTLRAMNYDQSHLNGGGQVAIFEARYARNGRGAPEAVCPPLKAQSGQTGKGDSAPLVFQQNQRNEVRLLGGDGQQAGALPAQPGMKQQNYVANTMTVRRLTPTECSRLQGYPDGFIPDTIADSHHYRLLGNSVAVPVVEWLLRRVVAVMEP